MERLIGIETALYATSKFEKYETTLESTLVDLTHPPPPNFPSQVEEESYQVILNIPVLSSSTGLAYQNYYCALCNEDANSLVNFTIDISCIKRTVIDLDKDTFSLLLNPIFVSTLKNACLLLLIVV